jgi:hypothetical protein
VTKLRRRSVLSAAVLAVAAVLSSAAVAAGPPPPTASNGHPVSVVATGVTTPTAFAFDGGTIFAGSGPATQGNGPTGLFTLANGTATPVPNTPPVVFGLAFHDGKLYVSDGPAITAYSGWDGTKFASSQTISAPKGKFAGFNGLAFSPKGRLYAGVTFRNDKFDHRRDPSKYAQSVVSMTAAGKHLRVVARGLRQPFQLTFVKGHSGPFVGILGADSGKKIPKDAIIEAKPGQNYGFPKCVFGRRKTCRHFAKPKILLPKHSSPMGIGAIGHTLYVSLFGGIGKGPIVAKVRAAGGKPKPFLSGFAAPVIALGINNGTLYVGDLTGTIYSVRP